MKGPGVVCFACHKPTTLQKPICDACRGIAGTPDHETPYCSLCEAGLAVDKFGQHTTKTGGYAGKCSAVQPSGES